jgi:two-component system sensor histidine kinase HydH
MHGLHRSRCQAVTASNRASRFLLLAAAVGLAAVLLIFALWTYRELAEMQRIYLHDRASMLADQLETFPADQLSRPLLEPLRRHEPGVIAVRLFEKRQSDDPEAVEAIRSGRELSRTEEVNVDGRKVFRAWMPFHAAQRLHIARIDLALTGADFLLAHARRNILVASLSGISLLMLALWALISARRAAELEKRQLQMEHLAHLGQMSAVLAHEIRNPLGTIKGFAQLACEKGDQRIASLLAPVLTEIGRLEKLVKDLLLYSKPCQAAVQPFDWGGFARSLRPFVVDVIGRRAIRFDCEPEAFAIETDPDLLKELLLNLLRNAVEALALADAGVVRLYASAGPPLVIVVEDDGPGMAKAVHGHLFEPFYTTKASGTGLGLSVARKLASVLGADLEFNPLQPHGTRVEVRFGNGHGADSPGEVTHGTYSDH